MIPIVALLKCEKTKKNILPLETYFQGIGVERKSRGRESDQNLKIQVSRQVAGSKSVTSHIYFISK